MYVAVLSDVCRCDLCSNCDPACLIADCNCREGLLAAAFGKGPEKVLHETCIVHYCIELHVCRVADVETCMYSALYTTRVERSLATSVTPAGPNLSAPAGAGVFDLQRSS